MDYLNAVTPSNSDEPPTLTHNHTLNRNKQTDKLIENASRADIDIEVNCNDENVNIRAV